MKPLLAEKTTLDKVVFPVIASPKVDGFRCLIHPGLGPVTRSIKPIANNYVRGKLDEMDLDYCDGELVTFTGSKLDDFNTVQSKITSRAGMPDFKFMAFDHFKQPLRPFRDRHSVLTGLLLEAQPRTKEKVQCLEQAWVETPEHLAKLEAKWVDEDKWEGVMLRSPDGIYKYGRSTEREGILLKLKRFDDDEGVIVGKKELLHNANEATTNALGYTERSSHNANKVGMDVLGAFVLAWRGLTFDLGTGFDAAQRAKYWRADVLDRTVKFKYQGVGPNGKPRFPVFLGMRDEL